MSKGSAVRLFIATSKKTFELSQKFSDSESDPESDL
jgi:hypothetical protein